MQAPQVSHRLPSILALGDREATAALAPRLRVVGCHSTFPDSQPLTAEFHQLALGDESRLPKIKLLTYE